MDSTLPIVVMVFTFGMLGLILWAFLTGRL